MASAEAEAEADLTICVTQVPEGFDSYGCKEAIKGAMRAGFKLEYIVQFLIYKEMIFNRGATFFDKSNVDQAVLNADIKKLLASIGSVSEANIDEVSQRINNETRFLGRKHYRYN